MTIDPTRGDWIKVCRVYAHCLTQRARSGSNIPGMLLAAAEVARDIADEYAAMDLFDAAVGAAMEARS